MTLLSRPYTLILLEVEESITGKGENRPLIVEAAYKKIIEQYGTSLTEDERVCLGAFRIIMEELALKNALQIDAARAIQSSHVVQQWGLNNFPDWTTIKADVQLARLIGGISHAAKAEAHEIIVSDGVPVQGSAMRYDFDDPKATTSKIAKIFLKDIIGQTA